MKRRGYRLGEMTLDKQQVEAVVACEDAQLVLASAGSGKTMSLLAKIQYLCQDLHIRPEKILAISFTKKTVSELIERCAIKGVEFRTFHALGNHILQSYKSENLARKRLVSEVEIATVLRSRLLRLCNDDGFARELNNYILFYSGYLFPPGDYSDSRRRAQEQECELVANWLYAHQIKYQFRKDLGGYKPDFTLDGCYLDLFALDRNGNSLLGSEYQREVSWRRKKYKRERLKHIELYSWWWSEGIALEKLGRELLSCGLMPRRRSESEIMEMILANRKDDFDYFLRQLTNFLSLYKNGLHNICKLRQRVAKLDKYQQKRATLFLNIFERVYDEYSEWLEENRLYDFADMINDAVNQVRTKKDCMLGYDYILLDEVQDLSPNRLRLVREILQKNPHCRLFAVGDDWQSIYRFTGSNLELIGRFEAFFGRHVRRSLIETTHRFGSPTVKLSSNFVQKNPAQAHKKVRGPKRSTPIKIVLSEVDVTNKNSEVDGFRKVVQDLLEIYGEEKLTKLQLQIISRFNNDAFFLKDANEAQIENDSLEWRLDSGNNLHFDFCSIHKSKGITRDIVVVLNMNNSLRGMPAQRENDPLIDMLLSDQEKYPFAEERRLFYVALTRARLATYLIAKEKTPSPFLLELSPELLE